MQYLSIYLGRHFPLKVEFQKLATLSVLLFLSIGNIFQVKDLFSALARETLSRDLKVCVAVLLFDPVGCTLCSFCFWPDICAAQLILESGQMIISSGVFAHAVYRGEWGPIIYSRLVIRRLDEFLTIPDVCLEDSSWCSRTSHCTICQTYITHVTSWHITWWNAHFLCEGGGFPEQIAHPLLFRVSYKPLQYVLKFLLIDLCGPSALVVEKARWRK